MDKIEEIKQKERYTLQDLLDIMKILRAEGGCPWDREQTHKSIRSGLIEETYEVVEAIDNDDMPLMREELGDLLLQVVFHAQIASEDGDFDFDDVSNDICEKMIVRHPHVFGDIAVENSGQVLENWDKIKIETKHQKSVTETLNSVSRALPSLMRASKIAKKSKKNGYEKPLEEIVGNLLFDIAALCSENDIDAEKALYDACERNIADVEETERKLTK